MKLTVYFDNERIEIERSVSDIAVYMRSRIRSDRTRTYKVCALDGAMIILSFVAHKIPVAQALMLRRDGHIIKAFRPSQWYQATDLFMVLVELVPRD